MASVVDTVAVNPISIKTLLADSVNIFFINGIAPLISRLNNPYFWFITFLAVSFSEIPLFSWDLITSIISLTSLFVGIIPEPVIAESPLSFFYQEY